MGAAKEEAKQSKSVMGKAASLAASALGVSGFMKVGGSHGLRSVFASNLMAGRAPGCRACELQPAPWQTFLLQPRA